MRGHLMDSCLHADDTVIYSPTSGLSSPVGGQVDVLMNDSTLKAFGGVCLKFENSPKMCCSVSGHS